MTNLRRFEFAELGIDIEAEIQSLPLRIFEHQSQEMIGVCLVEAAGVGQATMKLLYIDSQKRGFVKPIHKALPTIANEYGFKQKLYQRKKNGVFTTFFKAILPSKCTPKD